MYHSSPDVAMAPPPPLLPFNCAFHLATCYSDLGARAGTPAAICRQQAWAVKHRDPKFLGSCSAFTRGPRPDGAPPTERGFNAGLKEDECEDSLSTHTHTHTSVNSQLASLFGSRSFEERSSGGAAQGTSSAPPRLAPVASPGTFTTC